MTLTFGQPSRVTSLESVSFVARRQATLSWQIGGGAEGGYPCVDEMLADLDVRWFVVCDERGVPVADFWQVLDTVVMFRAASTDVFGQATEDGFVCGDLSLWTAMASADDAPRGLEPPVAMLREVA